MLEGELMAWPLVMIVLILAFGSLVGMSLPLLLAMLGLATTFGPCTGWAIGGGMAAYGAGNFYGLPGPRVTLEPPSERWRKEKEGIERTALALLE